ncbi:MAG: 2-oxoacid:acceptor oxidoreductase family protein [Candidatus Omnitrophica bacterium]|nr:2-oxoacid:acceptor oxidoreductase family protein [Candidatus Omnitrophota bacterium]
MIERIIIAGSGGQGIMLLGKVLATAVLKEDKQVSWLPAYGPEVRGGSAHCSVIISDEEISSPWVDKADTLIVMNGVSFKRFRERVKKGGSIILNKSFVPKKAVVKGASVLQYPFTEIAAKLGNVKVANIVALGCYLGEKNIVRVKSVFKAMQDIAPEQGKRELIEINKRALLSGKELVE